MLHSNKSQEGVFSRIPNIGHDILLPMKRSDRNESCFSSIVTCANMDDAKKLALILQLSGLDDELLESDIDLKGVFVCLDGAPFFK